MSGPNQDLEQISTKMLMEIRNDISFENEKGRLEQVELGKQIDKKLDDIRRLQQQIQDINKVKIGRQANFERIGRELDKRKNARSA